VKTIYAVELNPDAHHYCLINVRRNKVLNKVIPILGDVQEVCPILRLNFDRVIMPLPKSAEQYLDIAIPRLQDGGILYFYHWASEDALYVEAEAAVSRAARRQRKTIRILERVRVLPYGPRKWKVRINAQIRST
jgi:tRNA (guanine37-N1)-methyltransferase